MANAHDNEPKAWRDAQQTTATTAVTTTTTTTSRQKRTCPARFAHVRAAVPWLCLLVSPSVLFSLCLFVKKAQKGESKRHCAFFDEKAQKAQKAQILVLFREKAQIFTHTTVVCMKLSILARALMQFDNQPRNRKACHISECESI